MSQPPPTPPAGWGGPPPGTIYPGAGAPAYPGATGTRTSGLAIASLVTGLFFWCWVIPGIVSIVLAEGALAAVLLTHKTKLWVHATSLGGVESTFERRRRWKTEPATIPEGLVRLSVGIEDIEDLWADLENALNDLG